MNTLEMLKLLAEIYELVEYFRKENENIQFHKQKIELYRKTETLKEFMRWESFAMVFISDAEKTKAKKLQEFGVFLDTLTQPNP